MVSLHLPLALKLQHFPEEMICPKQNPLVLSYGGLDFRAHFEGLPLYLTPLVPPPIPSRVSYSLERVRAS